MESPSRHEEHFTTFIDFLGFAEGSAADDEERRAKILELLLSLSTLRGDFDIKTEPQENGRQSTIRPAITTFSDHIVISFPIAPIAHDLGDDRSVAFFLINTFVLLLKTVVAAALRIGFLVRGGATIGELYHTSGVVFGKAMVEAYRIESEVSVYPQIVLSQRITSRPDWKHNGDVMLDHDGLYCFDYFRHLFLRASAPGVDHQTGVRTWLHDVVAVISKNLQDLEQNGNLKVLAKWEYFAREFRRGLENVNPQLLSAYGIKPAEINWWPERQQPTTSLLDFKKDAPK